MPLPKSIKDVIDQEIRDNQENSRYYQLIRRKGDQPKQRVKYMQDQRSVSAYDVLRDESCKTKLLKFWVEFHAHFSFPDFATFYGKRNFCLYFSKTALETEQLLSDNEYQFISLLADRKFLFLEDNGHGRNPEYPAISEIVHNPNRYLTSKQIPEEPNAEEISAAKMRENAKLVLEQGFVPTYAHKWAYDEMKRNETDIRSALQQREEFIQRSSHFLKDGVPQFPIFTIPIQKLEEQATAADIELSQLFHDFISAARYKAYVRKYDELLESAKENSLPAIVCVRRYLEQTPDISIPKSIIFWRLFTQETKRLAKGALKSFKFRASEERSGLRLTGKTQATTYRKIDCNIMLFDYLLKLFPPEGENEEWETAYIKFQFHIFSRYNGYAHFRINDIKYLANNSSNGCKYNFDLTSNSEDCVDHLGGVIRYHILRCVANDVRWLTPGLPNNWDTNSSILATLLLQDSSRFPKVNHLINRIHSFLNDKEKGEECLNTYLNFHEGQSELVKQMEKWCSDNYLIFEGDIPSSDVESSPDKMKLLCSRFVLEFMLKERSLLKVRQGLAAVAQKLWGHLLLTGYETFYLDEDT